MESRRGECCARRACACSAVVPSSQTRPEPSALHKRRWATALACVVLLACWYMFFTPWRYRLTLAMSTAKVTGSGVIETRWRDNFHLFGRPVGESRRSRSARYSLRSADRRSESSGQRTRSFDLVSEVRRQIGWPPIRYRFTLFVHDNGRMVTGSGVIQVRWIGAGPLPELWSRRKSPASRNPRSWYARIALCPADLRSFAFKSACSTGKRARPRIFRRGRFLLLREESIGPASTPC